VHGSVRAELAKHDIGSQLPPGARIAIGAGSRGIANLATIVQATVAHFRERGFLPFIFPAMGSHGGGTGAGQTDVLAHYGITAAAMGCPVLSSMETVSLGNTPEGIETVMDRTAAESDGVFLVNRIKWHTTFEAPVESGLLKMAAIGMGKLEGATNYHRHVVRILFEEVDILIVDEVGKHISGVGMDSKVINRHPWGGNNLWPWAPRILRVYVRSLSPQSYGNAVGIGMADMISERLYNSIDWNATKVNALAACNLGAIRTPVRAGNDREALELLTKLVGRGAPEDVTCVWIRNTLELTDMAATENLVRAGTKPEGVDIVGPPAEWAFDRGGDLLGGIERHVSIAVS